MTGIDVIESQFSISIPSNPSNDLESQMIHIKLLPSTILLFVHDFLNE